ncbi:ABC transporter ATP-binding protein [Neotamlana nanhaiensis]|uniref:ABC transporter ATP-binding protein n=1 Tax=Neotamlana nanhaiensis TaxID=1382798 RepID=UPI0009E5C721|nr:ATP-binding cassette domain-containing protein [Tamlana nanhaiensis]
MIQTKNISFQYQKNDAVFTFPDINLGKEEPLLILGKSGIGKTTLLHIIAGLLNPKSGEVTIDGTNLQSLNSKQRDQFIGKHIGLVFQKNFANRSLTVLENLEARLFFSGKTANKNNIPNLLKALQIEGCQTQKINELSEGQLQRLGIALAVIHEPKLILADEPTASLDDDNCQNVMQLLINQAKTNKSNLIVITHDQRVKSLFQNILTL